MPKVGDTVLYGNSGACRIEGIVDNSFGQCYVLVPYFLKRTKITVPLSNDALTSKMRPVPAKAEARKHVKKAYSLKTTWIDNESQRKNTAKEVISGDDDVELLRLIRSFRAMKSKMADSGKKFHVSDDHILKSAEERLCNEYAVIFDIEPAAVPDLVESIQKNVA